MKAFLFIVYLSFTIPVAAQDTKDYWRILEVEDVHVSAPVGTAPLLPYQIWASHADGHASYRQVKWTNASLATEQEQAALPVGTSYQVQGFIVGDNTTSQGFPVVATVQVVEGGYATPAVIPVAEPLPLGNVHLTGDNRLTHNRDLDIDNLLKLDVRQQLYNYRDTYGLPTDGYTESDGWDSPTTKLKGHGTGHYMSAMSLAYASCADAKKKKIIKDNIRIIVNELRRCQERTFVFDKSLGRYREARDLAPEEELRTLNGSWSDFDRFKQQYQHYGYGYLNAIPAQHCVLIEKYSPYNNEQGVWAPYYSVHKQLAGLIDIANYIDDKAIARKALLIARDMGLWVWNRLHYRTFVQAEGTQEERRSRFGNRYEMWNMYIAGEVGGMAESLASLSEMVGNDDDRAHLLEAATFFDSPAFFLPLTRNIDAIRTRHANQHIPMVTGALRTFRAGGPSDYYHLAHNFWTMVQGRYRYAMGGVGNGEMFRQPYSQILSMYTFSEPTLNETCCAYNLAKLTRELNTYNPNDARYMDYYERVLYNQLVGSIHPDNYAVLYQYAVGLNASKPWGNETPQSTCCGGTGAENHVKYQEAAYFAGGDTLWVALYLPTTARWDSHKVTVEQTCEWPSERSVLRFPEAVKPFVLKLRVPYWATERFDVKVNGVSVASRYQPSSYITLPARRWQSSDVVEITMPFTAHIDFGPDKTPGEAMWCGAFMRGPLVMAATGIQSWEDATVDTWSPSLPLPGGKGRGWVCDYAADEHCTHYFRFRLPGESITKDAANDADYSRLREAMQVARSRSDAQNAWQAASSGVAASAPWAPHGFASMMNQLNRATALLEDTNVNHDQATIDAMTTELNIVLNAMRPGNLPELEDLEQLHSLLEQARKQPSTPLLDAARDYADMVVKYVTDGSGTHDMIERAVAQLKRALSSH